MPYPNPDGTTGTDLDLKADPQRPRRDPPPSTTRFMQATQRPFSASSFADTTQEAACHTIPSWALLAAADKAARALLTTQRRDWDRLNAEQRSLLGELGVRKALRARKTPAKPAAAPGRARAARRSRRPWTP